ncbi:hypothetical protein Q5741_02410 [Paenibacillus sp. JX-17]|uniref:Helicase XPB/Ssl2 N-terminal domain-containing protein n=1 Tax=Paenibacillus lacisoli TaxID=3064525 RepID=A0ABT9C7Q8_9BACL|nr:hypothetical protein [Paenibacillus sp. JX-17]MDO7905265.1 hypothetical protein [Paenibacillus sp. JX-17]
MNQWEQLTGEARLVLRCCLLQYGSQWMPETAPRRLLQGRLSGVEVVLACRELLRTGWMKSMHKGWGEVRYAVPERYMGQLLQWMLHPPEFAGELSGCRMVAEASGRVTGQLLHLMAGMYPKGLQLTLKGALHKKAQQLLNERSPFALVDGMDAIHSESAAALDSYSVVFELLVYLGMLRLEERRYAIDEAVLNGWLARSNEERLVILYDWLTAHHRPDGVAAELLASLLQLQSSSAGRWINVSAMLAWLQAHRAAGAVEDSFPDEAWNWLLQLSRLDLGDAAVSDEGTLLFRWSIPVAGLPPAEQARAGEQSEKQIYVQPDMDILVPLSTDHRIRWLLEIWTERVSHDRMSVYRLSAQRFTSAVAHSSPESFLLMLKRTAASGIPEHVQLLLEQWCREWPSSVSPGDTFGQEGRGPSLASVSEPLGPEIPSRKSLEPSALPAEEMLFAGLQQVPLRWTQMDGAYHPSTARKLVEQAVQWETKLALSIAGESRIYIPAKVEDGAPWSVSGWFVSAPTAEDSWPPPSLCSLSPDDWNGMRIVVPPPEVWIHSSSDGRDML